MKHQVFTDNNGNKLERISRWITIKHAYNVSKKNALAYYATDENGYKEGQTNFNPENGLYLDYFHFNGKNYAIEQFISNSSMWSNGTQFFTDTDGKLTYIAGYDSENYYNPILIELDEYCEHVRIYKEVN